MTSDAKCIEDAIEIVDGRLYWLSLRKMPSPLSYPDSHFFTIDRELQYLNFFLDYGPLSLAQTYRFCKKMQQKMQSSSLKGKKIYQVCGFHPHRRMNACVLMCAYQIFVLGRSADEAFAPFKSTKPKLIEFHDASPLPCTYKLTAYHAARAMQKARDSGIFDIDKFDLDECEYYENVENGDLNWIVHGRCMAFAGPQTSREAGLLDGYSTLTPEDYFDYFKLKKIRNVIRLNKKYYDKRRFDPIRVRVHDIYFRDGTTPTLKQVQIFNSIMETIPSGEGIGVHCKAGLGRTGTLIGCYLMKHHGFTHFEAIGWIRICRPGSIIGPQQHFLQEMQSIMWKAGNDFRKSGREIGCGTLEMPSSPDEPTKKGSILSKMFGALSTRRSSKSSSSSSAITDSLPGDEWVQTEDPVSGRTYYYNRRTRRSSWTLPDGVVPTIRSSRRSAETTQGDRLNKAKRSPGSSPTAKLSSK